MIKDLRLHGSIGIADFFAFATGASTNNTYFYEEEPSRIRFFSRGNEFTITENHVTYKGTGGSFCEYMFGVEKPVKDMEKSDILNRLIMFGAFLDDREQVVFTNNTEGIEPFGKLFLQGHAVTNYYFIVSSEFGGDYRKRQRQILKAVGKFLKRTALLSGDRDTKLLSSFCSELNEERSIVFIFKIINRANQEYYSSFSNFYAKNRELTPQDELILEEIVLKNGIDRYQQERMKIDVMYKHPDNRIVVDEYRDILMKGVARDTLHASEYARLNRLRTLSIRNNIPIVLFDTLDELLLKGRKIQETEEQEYLKDSRAILENLFFKDPTLKQHIIKEDIVRLIKAKHMAYSQNDRGFEQVLLDIGK
ncbi:MAG: TIGR04442 family protein, partial [Nitrospirae bacterium]|nr:TIGR04442 family protein [Nitrospirota bacterium]